MARTRAETFIAKLKAQLEQGKLNLRAAELQIKRANLSRQEKKDALAAIRAHQREVRMARQNRRQNRAQANTQLDKWIANAVKGYGKSKLSDLDRHNYGQVAHRAIAMLAGAFPFLTKREVVQMISARFGSDVATDERILRDINARFRR